MVAFVAGVALNQLDGQIFRMEFLCKTWMFASYSGWLKTNVGGLTETWASIFFFPGACG